MIDLDDKFWVGLGNEPAGTDGGLIVSVEADGTLQAEYAVDEQGIHDMHLRAGKIYVPGTDPTDDWTLGNLYIRDTDGTWMKRRTLPLTIHTWGLCHDPDGYLWAAVGAHAGDDVTWEGRVMRSTDDGLTWNINTQVNNYRMYDIEYHADVFWAIGYTATYNQILYRSDDGISWIEVNDATPERLQRFVKHGDLLICQMSSRNGLIVIDDLGSITTHQLGSTFRHPSLNCMASDGALIYCIDASGYVWRSVDFEAWERYSHVPNAISIGYWQSQNCLIVSDKGAQAKLWKIEL